MNIIKNIKNIKKIDTNTFLQITLFSLIHVLFFYSLFRRYFPDEIESIHTAWKILFNGEIYKDFFSTSPSILLLSAHSICKNLWRKHKSFLCHSIIYVSYVFWASATARIFLQKQLQTKRLDY